MRHRLVDKTSKRRHVEPRHRWSLVNKLLLPRFGQWKAQLVAAHALRLYFKARRAFQVGCRDPELAGVFTRCGQIGRSVVINDSSAQFFGCGGDRGEEKDKEQTGTHTGFHHEVSMCGANYKCVPRERNACLKLQEVAFKALEAGRTPGFFPAGKGLDLLSLRRRLVTVS